VIAERCFGDDKNVMLAGGEIDLLDLDSDFLGELFRRFAALGASLTLRIPWSVQLMVNMNVAMSSSMGYTCPLLAARTAGQSALC